MKEFFHFFLFFLLLCRAQFEQFPHSPTSFLHSPILYILPPDSGVNTEEENSFKTVTYSTFWKDWKLSKKTQKPTRGKRPKKPPKAHQGKKTKKTTKSRRIRRNEKTIPHVLFPPKPATQHSVHVSAILGKFSRQISHSFLSFPPRSKNSFHFPQIPPKDPAKRSALNLEAFGRGGVAATAEGQALVGLIVLFGL